LNINGLRFKEKLREGYLGEGDLLVAECLYSGYELIAAGQVEEMWGRIAERNVTERPGSNEPRRGKRRPKCSRWLQNPRHEHFEHFRSDETPLKILGQAA